jgi:parallel beta-helix repeat protein
MSIKRWQIWILFGICIAALLLLQMQPETNVRAADPQPTPSQELYVYLPLVSRSCKVEHVVGDWVVSSTELKENSCVLLDGNLIVRNNGYLTLRNVRLALNGTTHGQYSIEIESGGTFMVENGSVISSAKDDGHFPFVVEEGARFEMRDSKLHGCGWGMETQVGPGDPPEPMPLSWETAGLYIAGDDAVLERNIISGNFAAIVLEGNGARIEGNTIVGNIYTPINILGERNVFQDNYVHHLPQTGYARCIDLYGHANHITDNVLTSDQVDGSSVGGIVLLQAWDNVIAGNVITATTFGIGSSTALNTAASNNLIIDNEITAPESGVNIHGRNNQVRGNRIRKADTGIEVMFAYDNLIAGNSLHDIGIMNGIRMTHSSGNSVVNNTITVVDSDGIFVWNRSRDNTFQGNIISKTFRGLAVFYDSDNNLIRDNTFSQASDRAILLARTSGNVVYRNNFEGQMAPFDDGDNQWGSGSEGNYWSGYTGPDDNDDGIGDVPYAIEPNGVDNYPLMVPVILQPAAVITPTPVAHVEPIPYYEIITDTVIQDREIVLETAINVNDGAHLTLKNVTVTLGSQYHPAFISVNHGGSLTILDSHFEGTDEGYGGRITAVEGTTLTVRNTFVSGIRYDWWNAGFEIASDLAEISNSHFDGVNLAVMGKETVISGSAFTNCLAPVWTSAGSRLVMTDSVINGSIWTAVNVSHSLEQNVVSTNRLSGVWSEAVGVWEGRAGITGNIIEDSSTGIAVRGYGSLVASNWISGTHTGVRLSAESGDNVVYHNSFLTNTTQAEDYGVNNQWDNGGEGNYWSDYTGTDDNGDGIGDIPYLIGPNGLDRYPLMSAKIYSSTRKAQHRRQLLLFTTMRTERLRCILP